VNAELELPKKEGVMKKKQERDTNAGYLSKLIPHRLVTRKINNRGNAAIARSGT